MQLIRFDDSNYDKKLAKTFSRNYSPNNKLKTEVEKIKHELQSYDEMLIKKDLWIVINKIDLISENQIDNLKESFDKDGINAYFISSVTKDGVKELTNNIYEFLKYENRIK